jgi:DNA-binding transcriptional ArsR family regulator
MFKELNILGPFFRDPEREYHIREIASILEISPATASKKLKVLYESGVLKHRKLKMLDLFKANQDSEQYRDIKLFSNISALRESGLIEALNQHFLKPTIILFGSAAFGLDTKKSDFDICLISEVISEFDASLFEKKLGKGIQLFVNKNLKDIKNKQLVNSILSGITIQGEIQWT